MGAVNQMAFEQREERLEAVNCWMLAERPRRLLAEMDAAERMADCWHQWGEVSKAFSDRAADIECELDNLRDAAIETFTSASGFPLYSDEWWEADEQADAEAPPVVQVMQDARRLRMGDVVLEQAA